MFETIYTIPINEAFDASAQEGKRCPFCRLYEKFEKDELGLILGGSMMEPDVRVKTNRRGFCRRHFDLLIAERKRLPLALILESHLNEIKKDMEGGFTDRFKAAGKTASDRVAELEKSCYLCDRIGFSFGKVLENAVLLWQQEPAFRKKAALQPLYCLPHFRAYLETARGELSKKDLQLFYEQISGPTMRYFGELCEDVSWFCKKFDYRYGEEPWGNSKDSVERAIAFLAPPDERKN